MHVNHVIPAPLSPQRSPHFRGQSEVLTPHRDLMAPYQDAVARLSSRNVGIILIRQDFDGIPARDQSLGDLLHMGFDTAHKRSVMR